MPRIISERGVDDSVSTSTNSPISVVDIGWWSEQDWLSDDVVTRRTVCSVAGRKHDHDDACLSVFVMTAAAVPVCLQWPLFAMFNDQPRIKSCCFVMSRLHSCYLSTLPTAAAAVVLHHTTLIRFGSKLFHDHHHHSFISPCSTKQQLQISTHSEQDSKALVERQYWYWYYWYFIKNHATNVHGYS